MRISYLIKKTATFKMLFLCLTLLLSVVITNQSYAQLTGTKTIPGTYATVTAAVADLNAQGVGAGGVTFDIAAGYTETLTATLSITATGTAANPIVFQKSGAGANPLITAYTGGTATPALTGVPLDGIIRLVGSDWVTLDGISLQENAANTTGGAFMEYGLAFYKVSGTDGCNNNTIKNCVITLNKNNVVAAATVEMDPGSVCVFGGNATFNNPSVALTVTSASGTNSNNKFYSNTFQSCFSGISLRGFADGISPFAFYDQANDIGGNSLATGNMIIDFGGGSTATSSVTSNGVKSAFANAANISYNTIRSYTGAALACVANINGILAQSANAALTNINNNTVTVQIGTNSSFLVALGIDVGNGSVVSAGVVNTNNNTITNCNVAAGTNLGNNGPMTGMRVGNQPATVNMNNNLILGDTMFNVGTFTGMIYNGANLSAAVSISNNQIYNIHKVNNNPAAAGGGNNLIGIAAGYAQTTINNNVIRDFTIINIVNTMNCKISAFNITSPATGTSMSVTNNQVYNLSTTGTSTSATQTVTNGIEFGGNTGVGSSNLTISGNTFYNFNSTNSAASGAGVLIRGMEVSTALTANVFNNKMYDFTCTGIASAIVGYRVLAGQNLSIYNNYIGRFFTPTANGSATIGVAEQIIGISDESGTAQAGQNHNFSYNTIYLSGTSTGANFGSTVIKTNVNPNTILRNNIFINNTTNTGGGILAAHRRTGTSLTTYMSGSNNNIFYASTPLNVAKNIYYDGTNSDLTLAAYKARVTGRDNASATELTPFLNTTTGASVNFLHINTAVATAAESGGANVSGITTDFDADIRQGNVGYLGTGTAPDIGADEFEGIISDLAPPSITAGTVLGACGTGDRTISGVIITDATGVPVTGGLVPRIYYKKNVGGVYFSQPGTLNSGTATNGSWSFTILAADMGGLTTADSVGYYFIAQDVAGTPNISSVPFGAVATDVNTVTTHPTTVNYYKVLNSLSGAYTVGAGGNYATITAAVAAYNTSCLSGPVEFSLTDASYISETFPIIINANPYASATNTLTIKPVSSIANPSGNVTIQSSGTTHTFALFGADYVTIQGSVSPVTNTVCPLVRSTRNLTIQNNNSISSNNCVIFIASNNTLFDGATNNKIVNCNIVGGATTLPWVFTNTGIGFGAGPVLTGFSTGTGSFGFNNSNNTVENNAISKVAYGIISQGFSFAIKNQSNVYNLNEMSGTGNNGIFRFGIFLGFENNVSITGNTFKNMIGQATGVDVVAINLGNSFGIAMNGFGSNEVTNAVITKNVIDNIQTFATIGSQSAVGIATSSSPTGFVTSGTNLIANNMISGITANSNGTQDLSCGLLIGNQVGLTTQIYNNTVNMNADGFATNVSNNLALFVGGGSGVIPVMDIKNNILVNTTRFGTGNNFVMALQIPGTAGNYANLQSDNNDFFVSSAGGFFNAIGVVGTGATPSINPGTNNFPTLASWQAQTGRDANSKNVSPVFVSVSNPHLVNTAAVNFNLNGTGVTLAAVTDDIDCEPRTGASSPDIGADEFSAPPVDLAFDAIKPTANTTCHGANEPIIVTVRNTGSTTINMAVDTIFVSTTYSGTISGTSIDTVYAGTLAPNATVDVTLEPAINTTVNGSYTFTTTITPIAGEGFTTNNNNVTTITINNVPVAATTSVFNNNLCLGYSTPITATATFGTLPYSYAWSPAAGLNSTNVASVVAAPAATTTYTVTVTDACGNTATSTALVNISIPGIQSVSPASRCGVGPVTLSGVPNAGSNLNWYTTPTGTAIAQANSNTFTPSITGTTTYYVSATTGNVPYYVGLTDLSPANGAVTFTSGAARGQMITANKPGAITGCITYPSNAATIITSATANGGVTKGIIFCLRLRGSTVNIATAGPFTFTLAQLGTPVQLNFNLPITTPGDYQLVYDVANVSTATNEVGLAQYSFSYTGTYPLSTADNSLVMPGGAFNSTNATVQPTVYNAFWNVQYTTYCESARQPVVATLLTAPVLTISPNSNICINDTLAISVTSNIADYDNYVWTASNTNTTFYTDANLTNVYVPNSSATTIYYKGLTANSVTFTCNSSNSLSCSNVASCTVVTQPALTSLSTNTYGICGSGSAILSITPTTGFGTGAILWESSTDSSNWSPVPGSTVSITTPVLSQKTYFRVSIRNSNNSICSQLGLDAINVYNPSVISAPGVTRCGVGTVNLVANVSAGATAQWYTSPTSQPAAFSGSSVTSPVIAATTTYYVAASEGSSTYGVGVPEASSTYGTVFTFSQISGPVTDDKPLWITVAKPGVLEKLTIYPTVAGSLTINLRSRGSAADILFVGPFTITAGQIGTAVELPVFMPLNTPGLYQITNIGVPGALLSPYNGAAGAYPFSTADGSLLINGSANNSTSVSAPTTSYNSMFNLKYATACESARIPVVVTVTPPPTFTTNVTVDTVCGQTPKMLNVTSPPANYDSIVWTPATGLFTDPAGMIAYVAGANEDTVYANPAVTTNYIVTAYDNIGGCVDTNKISIAPIYILPSIATNANLTEVCGSGSVLVNVSGIFNANLATYQWESSTDNTNWTPVLGGTGTSLLTPVLTQSTYFHCVIYCTGSIIGDSPALLINVNNPLITSFVRDTVCGSGTPTLQATASPLSATINWYDAPTGGYLVGSGNSFTTPLITATTNYYAEASTGNYTEPVGLPVPNPSGGVNLFPGRGLRFSATKQLTINSVTVRNNDATGSGFMDIALQDNLGNEITSTGIVGGLTPGDNTIPLNFVVPVGTDYRLVIKNGGGGTFYSSSNPVTYPMNSFSGAMSITAGLSQTGVTTTNVYYFFYGMNITAACYSPRVAVEAFVKTTPAVTVTASATSVCAGSNVSLSASSGYDPNYSYYWLPDGLSGSNVSVSPTASTIYTLVATDISGGPNNGCQAIKTIAISIIPAIPPFTLSPATYPLCLGSSVNINVNVPVLGGSAVIGTSTVNANGPTNYPAPYGELYETAKHQILILASELTAQGMTAGSEIKTLAFDVQSVGAAGIMNGYRIQMASTNVNSLTTWVTSGLTPVFGPVNYQPVVGSNVHTLSSAFVWDGTSNIVVQTCFSNDPTGSSNAGTANAVMNRSTTVFNSVLYTNFNDLDVCPLTPSFVTSVARPNMVLGYDKTVSYSWAPATGLNNTTSSSVIASPSVSTIYTVTITNTLFGCTATSTSQIDVAQVLKPYLNVGDSTLCSNDAGFNMIVLDSGFYSGGYPAGTDISFYGAGAILYQNGASNTFFNQNNSDAFYAVVTLPTYLGGCVKGTDTAIIDFNSAQAPQYLLTTDSVKCFGGSTGNAIVDITFGGTANFRYQWYDSGMNNLLRDVTKSGTNDSLKNVPAGMYVLVITDHQGATVSPYCSVIDSVYVGEPSTPVGVSENILNHVDLICNGATNGALGIDVIGGTPGYSYSWSNGSTLEDLTGIGAGTYTVVVSDSRGCTATVSITLTQPSAIIPNCNATPVSCNGGSDGTASVTASGGTPGYAYLWSTTAVTSSINGLLAGTYTVTVTDANGCSVTCTSVVTEPTVVTANCSATPVSCNGGSDGTASVTAGGGTPGYTYLWSTAAVTSSINGLAAGTYTVTVTDANGCSATCTSVVTEPTLVTANCSATPVSCNGGLDGTASVTAGGGTPGYTYLWSTAAVTSSINGLAAGTYTVTVTDANGCSATCTSVVAEPTAVTANCNATPVSCNGGSNGTASVTAGGGTPGYTYLWSTAAITSSINGLSAGTYTVTVTDANGCSATCTSVVAEPNVLVVTENLSNHNDIVCFGDASGSLDVNVSGGTSPYYYMWSNGYTVGGIQTGLVVGTYTVTVTDANACSSSITMTLTTNPLMTPTITGNVYTCGGATTLSTQVYASYLWSNGATTQSTVVSALGTYTVTVTNSFGCTQTATKAVISSSNIPAKPSSMTGIFIGNCVKLNMTYTCSTVPGALTYNWTVPPGVKIISGQGTNSIVVNYTPAYTGKSGIISVAAVNLCGSSPALKRYTSSRLTSPVISGSNTMCPGDIKTYTVAPVAGALSYTWTKVAGSTILSGQGTNTVTIKWGAVGGVIKCTANNACGASVAANFGVSLTCAKVQSDKYDFSELSLYPNPASTSATLQFNGFDNGKGLLQVFDLVGQLVITQDLKVTLGQNQYQLDLATLPKGIYSIRVVYNGMVRIEKLIVQ